MTVANFKRQCDGNPRRECPKTPKCGMDCHFNNADTAQDREELPAHAPKPWYRRLPFFRTVSAIGAFIGFVIGAYRFFSTN